jgi:anti-sigma factor RsiW
MTELSDDLLVAYVDGQLANKQAAAVEKVLDQDDVLAQRVAAFKDAHARLEAAFDAVLAGEELGTMQPAARGPRSLLPQRLAANAALGLIGLMIALALAFAGYGWPVATPRVAEVPEADFEIVGSIPSTWQENAARAQSLLGRATLEVGLESQTNADFAAVQLGQAIGPGFVLPDLSAQGYQFKRAELLRAGAAPLALLLYLGESGPPLSLYAKRGDGETAPLFKQYGLVGSVAWTEGGMSYFLAGEGREETLMPLAEAVRRAVKDAAAPVPAPQPAKAAAAPKKH